MRTLGLAVLVAFLTTLPFRDLLILPYAPGFVPGLTVAVGFLLAFVLVVAVVSRAVTVSKPLAMALLVYFAARLLSSALAAMAGMAFNPQYLTSTIQYAVLALAAGAFVRQKRDLDAAVIGIAVGCAVVSAYAVWVFNSNVATAFALGPVNYRAAGGFRSPAFLGLYLVTVLPLLLFYPSTAWVNAARVVRMAASALGAAALLLALMRSAYLAMALTMAFAVFVYRGHDRTGGRVRTAIIVVGMVGVAYAFLGHLGVTELVTQRVESLRSVLTLDFTESSLSLRRRAQLSAVRVFMGAPLFGVGAGNVPAEIAKQGLISWHISAENLYLQLLAEHGLVLAVAALAIPWVWRLAGGRATEGLEAANRALNLGLLGFMVMSFTINTQHEIIVYALLGLRFGNSISAVPRSEPSAVSVDAPPHGEAGAVAGGVNPI